MNMKYLYIMIITLAGYNFGLAQDSSTNTALPDFLSEYKQYFSHATIKENGNLDIQADSVFISMDIAKKNAILELALKKWDGEMIFIHSGYKREIWRRNVNTGVVSLVGSWNLNDPEIDKYLPKALQTTKFHTWFFYVGGQINFNSEHYTLFLSARIGSFLLEDRWDLALSGSISGANNNKNTTSAIEIGVLSKFYYPIKKYRISPYAGLGLSWVSTYMRVDNSISFPGMGGEIPGFGYDGIRDNYLKAMLLLGISWYVGPGSLDVGLQIGRNLNMTIGYTFSF